MNMIQRRGLGLACLVLASLSNMAQADTITGKVTSYQIYTNTNGDHYNVTIGAYLYKLQSARAIGELLREAFLRKLTVTVNFTPTVSVPYTGLTGYISVVTMQSSDLP